MNNERKRLQKQRSGEENWRLWGPYLSERAWGTVREDYSAEGTAWRYFNHDQARSRAYRWTEDGIGGICDEQQRLCFALALWNGQDPFLKERAFGLTGKQGNRGEDVKEYYFYKDATPSHSYMRYAYKYPQAAFPYQQLLEENRQRGRDKPPFNLQDTGVFNDNCFWDVDILYAKAGPEQIHIRIIVHNHAADSARLHLLPTLWFRNTWAWSKNPPVRPLIQSIPQPESCAWAVQARHDELGQYYLYGQRDARALFSENDSNKERLWNTTNSSAYVKDAFHRYVVDGDEHAINPANQGSKFAAWHSLDVDGGQSTEINLLLSSTPLEDPFKNNDTVLTLRRAEADVFFDDLLPQANLEDNRILRQSIAGMIWGKQFYHYDVARWLDGDIVAAPEGRAGRNHNWRHFKAAQIISMPDTWEYPWFAAWDLAYHCATLSLFDIDFAKDQIELMLHEDYLHPNGQLPAYEWEFGDANPPVHAMGALEVYRAERAQRGTGDLGFLQRVFNKLLLNYAWWINRKDSDNHNIFEGGFLGLDNISVLNRSEAMPLGYTLKQADATGWMAMFSLNMTVIALELATQNPNYEDIAIQTYRQFLAIASAIAGHSSIDLSLWDGEDKFFKDLVITPDGKAHHIDVFSWVGIIPLFACEIIDQRLLENAPRFRQELNRYKSGLFDGEFICACPARVNDRGEHLLSLVDHTMLPGILERIFNEDEFLSRFGVRSLSRIHATQRELGNIPGLGAGLIEYIPGESNSGLFGGNSNWRGPVWMPLNYSLIQALEKFHNYLGEGFTIAVPAFDNQPLNLHQIAQKLSERLVDLFRRNEQGIIPSMQAYKLSCNNVDWADLLLFHEYFHAETGQGLGAAHQTGWTALVSNLVMRRYRK